MIAPFIGVKRADGLPLQMGDFFPDLAPVNRQVPEQPSLRVLRGRDPEGEEAFTRGWDRWAKISRAVASGKKRKAVS